jgi:hypothetical protein
MRYGAVVFDADMAALLILEALPSFERRAKASCLASRQVGLGTGPSTMCLSGTTCQVGTPPTEGPRERPPTDRTTPDCTSTSQLPVRSSLSYLNKELTARAANLPAPVNSNGFCANDSWKT